GREKVTHQTSPPAVASGMVAGTPPSVMVTGEPAPEEATDVDALDGSPAGSGPHARARARWSRPDSQSSPAGGAASSPRAGATRRGRALWYGHPLSAALGVASEESFCVASHWHATVDGLNRTPLVTVAPLVGRPRPPRGGNGSAASAPSMMSATC